MNVRITPRDKPQKTLLYGGVRLIYSTGEKLELWQMPGVTALPLSTVAEIALDDDPGDIF